jgi:hypothetical protein
MAASQGTRGVGGNLRICIFSPPFTHLTMKNLQMCKLSRPSKPNTKICPGKDAQLQEFVYFLFKH